jgi:quercetin dioxygenase-like cupin family protein
MWTKANLAGDVPDLAKDRMPPGIAAHFARKVLEAEQLGVTLFRLEPGARTPFGHRHATQEEVYVVLSGGLRVVVGDDDVRLGPLDALRVAPEAWRAFEAGPDGCELLAIGAGGVRDAEVDRAFWDGR